MKNQPEYIGMPITSFEVNECIVCDVFEGHRYYYAPVRGMQFYAYDLDTRQKVCSAYTGINSPRGCALTSDHKAYVCGDHTLFQYDPCTRTGRILPDFNPKGTTWCMTVDDQDNLYMGSSPGGNVLKYNPATGETTSSPRLLEGVGTIRSLGYHNGFIYANGSNGTGNDKILFKLDSLTLQPVAQLNMQREMGNEGDLRVVTVAGDLLLCSLLGRQDTLAVDLKKFRSVTIGPDAKSSLSFAQGRDGKYYAVSVSGGLREIDPENRTVRSVPGFENANIGFRCSKHVLMQMDDPELPGDSLFTCDAHDGTPVFYNLETGKTVRWPGFTGEDGGGHYVRAFANGPKGSGELYMGAYQTDYCSVYNTHEQRVTCRYNTGGHQTDSQVWYRGKVYAGVYATGCLTEADARNNTRRVLIDLKSQHHQARIHTMTAGDGKVFAGTTPDIGLYGGCIAWYDLDKEEAYVERNVIKDQTIHCVVYQNGYLYGTGSTLGGTKTFFTGDAAKIFVYDVANRRKIGEYTVDIAGIDTPPFIAGIAADPNIPGKFWGVVSETLFSFTFDSDWKIRFREEVSFGKDGYYYEGSKQWFPRPILFGEDGYLYVCFDQKGGMRRINPQDPQGDNERIMEDIPMHYILGEDGFLYYAENMTDKMRYLKKLRLY